MPESNVIETTGFQKVTIEQIQAVKNLIAKNATNEELILFVQFANRTKLDPMSKQIHFVKRGTDATFQTSIDGYRTIAERTGNYAGNDDYKFDEGLNEYEHIQKKRPSITTATATVYKIVGGTRVPFSATARWSEYCPTGNQGFMWKKMPYLMIGKCAEALALRKAFPNDLNGLYTSEEMQQADNENNKQIKNSEQPKNDPKPKSDTNIIDAEINEGSPAEPPQNPKITGANAVDTMLTKISQTSENKKLSEMRSNFKKHVEEKPNQFSKPDQKLILSSIDVQEKLNRISTINNSDELSIEETNLIVELKKEPNKFSIDQQNIIHNAIGDRKVELKI